MNASIRALYNKRCVLFVNLIRTFLSLKKMFPFIFTQYFEMIIRVVAFRKYVEGSKTKVAIKILGRVASHAT